ncbi:type II toxin-antitoxin system RelE/ParE family toxin [Cytophagales bacterium LB-30]|uniref:Type II toxin-antitoxin system RelE/ParE family toxin n=1 Tax=Shiella aurantiaca TaxID=3058365 RepID=A0ABT8F5K5_9BACT|nr:type II toxin-antitoxin system RelE/ParE family toxin [Shiella aurantiaca]MDN4165762.1 type II toxin-antitoxin system RelE/ParE family toxin [Shiella aurantiaca]
MAEVIWTQRALHQLEKNILFIKNERGLYYATTVTNKILNTIDLLENQPQMGTLEPLLKHKKSEYRFLIVWSYKLIYRIYKNQVIISRVFHTSRNPQKLKGL